MAEPYFSNPCMPLHQVAGNLALWKLFINLAEAQLPLPLAVVT